MKTKRVILDTNVLYSALYSSLGASYKIIRLVANKKIKPVISTTLLFEYEDILKRKQKELYLNNQEIDIVLDSFCALSDHQKIFFLWRPTLTDPKDDHILELAIASNTNIIITHNIKDFKNINDFDVKVLTPKKYLEYLK